MLHATTPAPLWEMGISDPLAYRVLQVEELVARSAEFDLIHSHVDYLPWIAGGRLRALVITTMHSRLDLPELRPLFSCMARSTTTASSGESCGVRPKRMSDRLRLPGRHDPEVGMRPEPEHAAPAAA